MNKLTAVVLAAGKGTRMKSALPKVLHKVGGKAMLAHVVAAAKAAGAARTVVVTGFGSDAVEAAFKGEDVEFVRQEEQLGTGHAVLQTEKALGGESGTILVLCGDTPLLTCEVLKNLCAEHEKSSAKATVLTAILPDAAGYGRIVRSDDGTIEKIVEQKDASVEEQKITEINSGIYCFDAQALFAALHKVGNDNAQGEYYLPDVLKILRDDGEKIYATATNDFEVVSGINSRAQLAAAEKILRRRKNEELMAAGVTLMDPDTVFVDVDVKIGRDTVIYPFTWIEGKTVIGENCEIGPNCRLQNMTIGNFVTGQFLYAHDATVCDGASLGQFVHLRPDTKIDEGVKIGNFVEVKNSTVGKGSKLPHLSYIGDCDMGAGVNMGCGTITVNYDGKNKFRTVIGDNVFVGCNSNLVAPVKLEDNVYVGAGSTITKDVPNGDLAIARARQTNIDHWADKRK